MAIEQLTLSDEQVQDIVASLITGGGGSDVVYDDANDTLTVSLSDSISVNTLEAEVLNNADIANASAESVPKAQGDGTLSFGSVGHVVVEDEGPLGQSKGVNTVASLNTARETHGVAEANGFVYAIGGKDVDGNVLSSVEEYDPDTDTWTTVSSLNTAREETAAVGVNGLVYAVGGEDVNGNSISSVEEYDPDTDTWTTVSSLNTARDRHAVAEANGLVYALGGRDGGSFFSSVEEYDPDTDTWTTVASLNTARDIPASAGANGLVYAIGGSDSGFNKLSSVEEYDPDTDTWTTVASMNTKRDYHAAVGVNGLVYAIGGGDVDDNALSSVEEYDPNANTWNEFLSLNTARNFVAAAEINDPVYVVAGENNGSTLASAEEIQFQSFADVYTATGDSLFGLDDPDGALLNRDTGRKSNPTLARDGETIAAFTETTARVFRTEES